MALGEDKYIDQIAVIGDERKFVSALIVPNYSNLENYAREHHLPYKDIEDLMANPSIYDFIQSRIEVLQGEFTSYERIKRFTLLPKPFTMENGELTNTLKLKRKVILERYKDLIDKMYLN